MQVVSQELAKVGIQATVDSVAATNFYTDVYTGKFQLAYNAETGGPSPVLRDAPVALLEELGAHRPAASSN